MWGARLSESGETLGRWSVYNANGDIGVWVDRGI